MAHLLMSLRHVPDDEADEIRAHLAAHQVVFYETRPGRWGVSAGGFWVHDAETRSRALTLLAEYQAGRAARAQAERETARREGRVETVWTVMREDPRKFVLALIGIVLMLALVALPVWLLWA